MKYKLEANRFDAFLTNVDDGSLADPKEVFEASSKESSNAIVSPCLVDTLDASLLKKLDKAFNVRLAFAIQTRKHVHCVLKLLLMLTGHPVECKWHSLKCFIIFYKNVPQTFIF